MKNILICWEMGDDFGHFTNFYPLIRELCDKGFSIYVAAKNLQKITAFDWPAQVHFLQAPVFSPSGPPPAMYSFADILFYRGYQSVDNLTSLCLAWKTIFELIKPVSIIVDHAPTALIAFRHCKIAKFIYSTGYLTLPKTGSDLNLRTGKLLENDKRGNLHQVMQVVNQYLINNNQAAISELGELYQVDASFIVGYKDIDIYKTLRRHELYLQLPEQDFGFELPNWPKQTDEVRFFAYLKHKAPHSEIVLAKLKALKIHGLCFYSGISESEAKALSSPELLVTHKPVPLNKILQQVNLVFCHGGQGLVNSAIRRGLPLILLPTQMEQGWTTKVLEAQKSALGIYRDDTEDKITEKIHQFFSNKNYYDYAQLIADKVSQEPRILLSDLVDTMIAKINPDYLSSDE